MQVAAAHEDGFLDVDGAIGGGRLGREAAEVASAIRGDKLGYFDGVEEVWTRHDGHKSLLKTTLDKMVSL